MSVFIYQTVFYRAAHIVSRLLQLLVSSFDFLSNAHIGTERQGFPRIDSSVFVSVGLGISF